MEEKGGFLVKKGNWELESGLRESVDIFKF